MPAVLAFVYVYWFPHVVNWLYRREIKYKVDREVMRMKEEGRLAVAERKKVEEESEKTKAEVELNNTKAKAAKINPEIGWQEEYNDFVAEEQNAFGVLSDLEALIYEYDGSPYRAKNEGDVSSVSVMCGEVNGLIEFTNTTRTTVSLTSKGKFFLKRYTRVIDRHK